VAGTQARCGEKGTMIRRLDRLVDAVQTNCHIADARHAGDLTLCTYLLEMFELYRWEQGMALTEQPLRAEVGKWLVEREALWESLADSHFMPLLLERQGFEPFAAAALNDLLAPHGLVYGAGIGRFGKPQFFLAQLMREERRNDVRILVAGREYARDLTGTPAALLGSTIYLRQESLKRWLWQKYQAWALRKPDGAFKATLQAYGFAADPLVALDRMAEAESETLILHELGEHAAGRLLGEDWATMRADLSRRRAELFLRAVRDNLADCLVTLPTLLERKASTSVHFWFSNFDGMRRELFPRLGAAYAAWLDGDDERALRDAISAGREHWLSICTCALTLHRSRGADAEAQIEALIDVHSTSL
jgi:hypothetical protein